MRRAWQQLVVAALCLLPVGALGYHTGAYFDKAPGAGGGGGLFYTGSPRERGWDCAACHTDPPGKIRAQITSEPAELFARGRYVPGETYDIHVEIVREKFGRSSGISNHNGMAVSIIDNALLPAGRVGGFGAGIFYQRGDNILATEGLEANVTAWDFSWTAPDTEDQGTISFYFGVVDGDGAQTPPDVNTTNPYDDDVYMEVYRADP